MAQLEIFRFFIAGKASPKNSIFSRIDLSQIEPEESQSFKAQKLAENLHEKNWEPKSSQLI